MTSPGRTLIGLLALAAPALPQQVDCHATQPGVPGPAAITARWEDIDYTGPSVPGHCGQRYSVFVPEGTEPPEGWPVLVLLDLRGFRNSQRRSFIDPDDPTYQRIAIAYQAVTNDVLPMVVVYASATVSRGGSSGIAVESPAYDPWALPPTYGPAYKGNGVFVPPDEIPPGYAESLAPWLDPERPMPEKDAVMLVQHIKQHAGSFPPGAVAPIRLDSSRLAVWGDSAGAIALMWVALGPDRREKTFPDPVPGSQEEQSTRVPAALLQSGTMLWRRYAQYVPLAGAISGVHHPLTAGAAGTLYDVPATLLGDNPDKAYQDEESALIYADDGPSTPLAEINASLSLLLAYTEGSSLPPPLCFEVDPQGGPGPCWFQDGQELNVHSSWSGHAWKLRHQNTYLVTTLSAAYDHAGFPVTTPGQPDRVPDLVLADGTTPVALASVELAWLQAQFLGAAATWTDLGQSADGTYGPPRLEASGSLRGNTPVSLVHDNVLEDTPVVVIIGLSRLDAPFLSGVLVPFPDLLHFDLPPSNADGRLVVSSVWPPGFPSGTPLYFQSWVYDPAAPYGWAATNAVEAITP